ncbi:Uncharacterised protein [Mycobacteroides abscessus]|nr:Uncharacterised protein [Mycobacteroides abscessus]
MAGVSGTASGMGRLSPARAPEPNASGARARVRLDPTGRTPHRPDDGAHGSLPGARLARPGHRVPAGRTTDEGTRTT